MKIYITVFGDEEVGIFNQYLTLDYPQLEKEHLDDVLFTNMFDEEITEREYWREVLFDCFSDLFDGGDIDIKFEGEEY